MEQNKQLPSNSILHIGLEVSEEHLDHLGLLRFCYETEAPRNHIYHVATAHQLDRICNVSLANYVLL